MDSLLGLSKIGYVLFWGIRSLAVSLLVAGMLSLPAQAADYNVLLSYGTEQSVAEYPGHPATTSYLNGYLEAGSRVLYSQVYSHNYYVLDLRGIDLSVEIQSVAFQWSSFYVAGGAGGLYGFSVPGSAPDEVLQQLTNGTLSSGGGTGLGSFSVNGVMNVLYYGNSAFVDFINANRGSVVAVRGGYSGSTRIEGGTPTMVVSTSAVPEPSTTLLLVVGLGIGLCRVSRNASRC